jgi:hypothetical protein
MVTDIDICVVNDDVIDHECDVLVLKYAQANFGVDWVISQLLIDEGHDPHKMRPKPGGYGFLSKVESIQAKCVLFVGVVPLYEFSYREIREFSRRCLTALASEARDIETVSLTLHGAGYGLDETEAFESELAGLLDAISTRDYPPSLKRISIVEKNPRRCERLQSILSDLLPSVKPSKEEDTKAYLKSEREKTERLRAAGYASDSKAHIFVAMPFDGGMDDVYHYGILGAVKEAGFLCERADISAFTGDVMQWVRDRIRSASVIVAELTDANPNVYLEVGYAWGCEKPTVLLAKDAKQLQFDVRGQRCIIYERIQDLETSLADELTKLKKAGYI